jgi:hypothetical protein
MLRGWDSFQCSTQWVCRVPLRITQCLKSGGALLEINDLVAESWGIYKRFENQPFLVKPSMPILFFGDSDSYFSSRLKVITLGLNPSRVEFPESDKFLRFEAARRVYPRILEGACYDEYLQALNGYFRKPPNHPYEPWFNSFEPLLRGLDCSYYGGAANTALHTDLCSPLATDPTWSNLPDETQRRLFECGTPLWHSLVEWLSPDLIIASLARSHLSRISFAQHDGWRVVYTVRRNNPYVVELAKLKVGNGGTISLVFGKAANTPFGTVSNVEKERIGNALMSHIYG